MKRPAVLLLVLALGFLLPQGGSSQTKVYKSVTNDTLEKILKSLELKFDKGERKIKDNSVTHYEFKRDGQTQRIINYGDDLWLECLFDRKLKPEDVNRWNAEAKFSRAVLLDQKDNKTAVSLEAQLDCLGGVTDATVKQFVNRFDEEARKFAKTFPK
jgi:hypothetical protein